jgi:hypothetical protein
MELESGAMVFAAVSIGMLFIAAIESDVASLR